jgi:hypothetical protein
MQKFISFCGFDKPCFSVLIRAIFLVLKAKSIIDYWMVLNRCLT